MRANPLKIGPCKCRTCAVTNDALGSISVDFADAYTGIEREAGASLARRFVQEAVESSAADIQFKEDIQQALQRLITVRR